MIYRENLKSKISIIFIIIGFFISQSVFSSKMMFCAFRYSDLSGDTLQISPSKKGIDSLAEHVNTPKQIFLNDSLNNTNLKNDSINSNSMLLNKVFDYFKNSNKMNKKFETDNFFITNTPFYIKDSVWTYKHLLIHKDLNNKNLHTEHKSLQSKDSISVKPKVSFMKKVIDYFVNSNKESQNKKFDFSILGGPYYSSDTKLGLGMAASGLYRIKGTDKNLSPSNISLYGNITTIGYYAVGIKGNTIFPNENYRIDMDMYFASNPQFNYWGTGYNDGATNKPITFRNDEVNIKIDLLKKLIKNTYIGATFSFVNDKGINISDPSYIDNQRHDISVLGMGVILSYDSRDFIPNPYKGIYLKIEQTFYPNLFKNNFLFTKTNFIADFYQKIWSGAVLAIDFQGEFNSKSTPWTMKAKLGNSNRMRGYYPGQYNDNKMVTGQIELRQHVYKRSGAVVWIGAGNVFPYFNSFRLNQTLPTYGVGYRWEFKKRVNLRLDYGFGRKQNSFYLNINEAF